jgi:hypothetical protein
MGNAAAILEEFFGTKFQPEDDQSKEMRELICFDGFVYWGVLLIEKDNHLHLTAEPKELFYSFPTLEIGVFYESLKVGDLPGIGCVLTIAPNNIREGISPMAITKLHNGRFSASVGMGRQSDE